MRDPRLVPTLATAAAMALVACGGVTTAANANDASTDAASSHDATSNTPDADADAGATSDAQGCAFCPDAGPDAQLSVCPASPPAAGSTCTAAEGELCEYGSSWWLGCNLVLRCQGGTWRLEMSGICPDQDAGGTCPATWAEASAIDAGDVVGPCPAPDCQYPEGSCECLAGCGGGGAPRPMLLTGRWFCSAATPECPSPRPDLGTPCSSDAGCQYGLPCGCGQDLQCVDGVWQGYAMPPCP